MFEKNPETEVRNLQIIAEYEKVPRRSMAAIGRDYGFTRAYIWQVVNAHYKAQRNEEKTT